MTEALAELHQDLRDLVGQTIADRYRIDSLIGVGGMAAVFRAHHMGLKRDVAIKILHPNLSANSEVSARFDREAESASRLDHPNTVQVTDYGSTAEGMKFMVMQLLEGGELADAIDEPATPIRVVRSALQILRGLEHAHRQGVIHRDIKPENVFITTDHEDREVLKLVDFGISKIVGGPSTEGHKTTAGLVFGTPAYMSPEQAAGMEADERADLYSVGIIMYQMLAGRLPFESDDPVALIRMQVGRDADPLPAHVPPLLAGIVQRLLDKDRERRYQTAHEVIETLENLLPALEHQGSPAPAPAANTGQLPVTDGSSSDSYPQAYGSYPRQDSQYPHPGVPMAIPPSGSGSLPHQSSAIPATYPSPGHAPAAVPYGGMPTPYGQQPIAPPHHPTPVSQASNRSTPWGLIAGGVGVCAVLIAVIVSIGGSSPDEPDEPLDEATKEALRSSVAASLRSRDPVEDETKGQAIDNDGKMPDPSAIATIDTLILGDKLGEAEELLKPLRDQFPKDAHLMWREGRLYAKMRRKQSQALSAYGAALTEDPSLLDDKDFYAEIYELLRNRRLLDEALALALQHMGKHGHKFLLERVNDPRRPLPYHDRQRALKELATDPGNDALINHRLRKALDIVQSNESKIPCVAYRDALAAIAAEPDYFFYSRVDRVKVPTAPGPGIPGLIDDDPNACLELQQRRDELLVVLEAMSPEVVASDEPEIIEIDDDEPELDPDCERFGAWFRSKCHE